MLVDRNREINQRSVQAQGTDDGGMLSGVGRSQIYELEKGLRFYIVLIEAIK